MYVCVYTTQKSGVNNVQSTHAYVAHELDYLIMKERKMQ